MNELLALDFTLDPTFNIYEASRDLHRARRAEWHETYTLPSLWRFYQPSKISHGSYLLWSKRSDFMFSTNTIGRNTNVNSGLSWFYQFGIPKPDKQWRLG